MLLVDITYGLYIATFLTGIFFFIRFDARRRPLRRRLLGVHLIMAVATFIMITAIVAVRAWAPSLPAPPKNPKNSTMWDYYHQHQSERKLHRESGPSTPIQGGGPR